MSNSITLILLSLLSLSSQLERVIGENTQGGSVIGRRILMSFKETPKGLNVTYDCSPSGPCIPCLYSEKKDDKYRCSETGYRIPLKCVESKAASKEKDTKKKQGRSTLDTMHENVKVTLHDGEKLSSSDKQRSLLGDSSTSGSRLDSYITYRSCIPATNEEKISVLRFEGIMLCLLMLSGSFVYFKRKGNVSVSGAVRVPTSSRF
ncbi:hypothetical protein AgCh_029883 [Apium graveolens]